MISGNKIIGLINKDVHSQAIFNYLQKKESNLIINSPLDEDVHTATDKWCNYDFQDLGFVVETVEEIICSISFRLNQSKLYNEKGPIFTGSIYEDLELLRDKRGVRSKFGKPYYSREEFDQFHLNEELILGLLYDDSLENQLVIASFGSADVFMNGARIPNRWSLIFESLKPHL